MGIVSFMIRYSKSLNLPELTEQKAALFITIFMALVLAGRLLGSLILKKFKASAMLVVSSTGAFILLMIAILAQSYVSLWFMALIGLFTSIMYPILFTLSIRNLGPYTKTASSLLIMGIVGGAVIPPIMGALSDKMNIQVAYIMPMICYVYVFFYAVKGHHLKHVQHDS